MSEIILESNCLICVMTYVKKLIDVENAGVDIAEFSSRDLLFLIGENVTDKNVADMSQAKEHFYAGKNIQYMR